MSMDLYYMPLSAPCRAVMLCAKAVGVQLNLKLTNLLAGEHMTPEFIKMNPQHTIPTLVDDGFILTESRAMLGYLVNAYGKEDTLVPKCPKAKAIVDNRMLFDMGTLYKRFAEAYYTIIFYKQKADQTKMKALEEALGWTNDMLEKTKYFAGDKMTIADYTLVASLSTIECVGHDLSGFPHIVKYMEAAKDEMAGYVELNQQGCDQFGEFAKAALKEHA